jgi:zinc protease
MTSSEGLGTDDRKSLERKLTTTALREFGVDITYGDESINLGGSPKDAETLFQMMYLQFTAPKLDTAALAAWKMYGQETLTQSTNDQIARLLARGEARFAPISPALVELASLDQSMAVYRDRFGDAGDFTFTIVGATPPEQVKRLVERYLASLPSLHRAEREKPKDSNIRPWAQLLRNTDTSPGLHSQRSVSYTVFDGAFPETPEAFLLESQRLSTLTWVLRRRLRLELRERMGATYSPQVQLTTYVNPREHYQVMITYDAAPERMDETLDVVAHVLDSLRTEGVSQAELALVSTIGRRTLETRLHTDDYWLGAIQQYDRLGIPLDRIPAPYVKHMTSDEIRDAARRYLPADAYIQLVYMPQDRDTTADSDSTTKAPSGH